MKKLGLAGLISLLLIGGIVFSPGRTEAYNGPDTVHNIFVDTMYGVATGLVLAAALTAAKGEGHGDEWGENLGAGAAVGGLLGAAFGVFLEYNRGMAEISNKRVCFHLPGPTLSPHASTRGMMIQADLVRIRF